MNLIAVSISHDRAGVEIREKVSFTKRRQAEILNYIKHNIGAEAVILSTCNRCEFYLAGKNIYDSFMEYLVSLVGEKTASYAVVYENKDCCEHLMLTASGLKSMILGEDQILGQVKDAYKFSKEHGACGKYLNVLFRIAVTGAKRVKTETLLSKTPVSAATVAIKQCQKILGTLNNKRILVIGATGKTGSIVLKDLASLKNVDILATSRSHGGTVNIFDGARTVDYNSRYSVLDECDAVISATLSPHLVLERDKVLKAITIHKKRVFIDLAVPRDIDILQNQNNIYCGIDDLKEIAAENNKIKITETEKAKSILQRYISQFLIWQLFEENRMLFTENRILREKMYKLKAENNYQKFCMFINKIKEGNDEY